MNLLLVLNAERRPLVALAMIAFSLRLVLLILGTALSANSAVASGLTALCSPSGQSQILPGSHNPADCNCGPVCAHGCSLGHCASGTLSDRLTAAAAPHLSAAIIRETRLTGCHTGTPIRAPPSFLI
ncbi:hypothetical protein E1180_06575 [Roseibium denhamense]|uniref:hypothetical protein n=1 Tax=Roseibium denhamense TaxID=76305 RepID=UPI0012BBBD50|nr:hypothetical protein [Roseibium denhamense]MTI05176.1 hypothetical protein [Roseibium denhamense]